MTDVTIHLNGRQWTGWKSFKIVRSLEALSHTWTASTMADQVQLSPGALVTVASGGLDVLRGYIEDTTWSTNATDSSVELSGRDVLADLVDCSVTSTSWRGLSLLALAKALAAPFKLSVESKLQLDTPIPTVSAHWGETAYQVLERCARSRGVLLLSTGKALSLEQEAGAQVGLLTLGQELIDLRWEVSFKERFSEYRIKGQEPGSAAGADAAVKDPVIDRFRPLVIVPDGAGAATSLAKRAKFERQQRLGRGTRVSFTVRGWTAPSGPLWAPNQTLNISVRNKPVRLLVVTATLTADGQGLRTQLECTLPGAYAAEANNAP